MVITISEAARQWSVDLDTIYRRQLAGQLRFATADPPTVEAAEMRRVFGPPDTAALARIEAVCELLKTEGSSLRAELATIKQELLVARDERDRLLDLIAALVQSQSRKSPLSLQRAEMTEAEFVLTVQQLIERRHPSLPERPKPENDQTDSQ